MGFKKEDMDGGYGNDEIEGENEDTFVTDGKVGDIDEFLEGEEISVEGEVTIEALAEEIKEQRDKELKEEEPTEQPIDISTHADMMQMLKRRNICRPSHAEAARGNFRTT